MYVVILG